MKTTIILFIALIIIVGHTYAQGESGALMKDTTPEQRAQFQTEYMKENLALSADQESRVHEVNLKYARKMQDAYNSPGKKMQKLKQMKALGEEKDKELKGVLDADQYATYEKNKEAMKEKIKAKAKEKRG
jgi:hypothetical protein